MRAPDLLDRELPIPDGSLLRDGPTVPRAAPQQFLHQCLGCGLPVAQEIQCGLRREDNLFDRGPGRCALHGFGTGLTTCIRAAVWDPDQEGPAALADQPNR